MSGASRTGTAPAEAFPERLTALLAPSAYSPAVERVEVVETHVSWVLLTGELAYKIKRPVCYPFVDQRSLERRAFLCREEVRLNRRFAPLLYLGVSPIAQVDGQTKMDVAGGTIIEWAVKMRQFRRDEELDKLLLAGQIDPAELARFGHDLAVIHAGLPAAHPGQGPALVPTGTLILRNLQECAEAARPLGKHGEVLALREPLDAHLSATASLRAERLAAGRVRECHGDLHSRNVVRQGSHLVAFDCLEFDPALRWIDVADEIAFLLMDLDVQQRPLHAQAFLGGYLTQSGDYQACRLLNLYKVHRALVRAKVAALGATGAGSSPTAESRHQLDAHLGCASRALRPKQPLLILMHGLSGSGKTWIARHLAPQLGAVHLRSDVERKRLAGLSESARSGSRLEGDLYSREATERVYAHLAQCARDVLAGAYTVIVDATFQRRAQRAAFQELAVQYSAVIIHCHAPGEVLERRMLERGERADDPSEADLSVLHWQAQHAEPIADGEPFRVIDVSTTDADALDVLARGLAAS